ncbi:MAG: 1-acyl-sn-glycerol-3-phosphate acyltransferase [Abitibacteriaceae bacterium]|nr:1-acyl-sn-glycerol-3-phosphate acyltransferase [Abditibacteriaceae bacterium]
MATTSSNVEMEKLETESSAPSHLAPDVTSSNDRGDLPPTTAPVNGASTAASAKQSKSHQRKADDDEIIPIHDWIYHLMFGLYSVYFRIGKWEIHGQENVPPTGPVIIAPNHVSLLDPPLVGAATPRLVTTMGKVELFEKKTLGIKVLGFVIQHMGTFPVRRGTPDRRAIRRAQQVLKDGGALVIFPEGTRTRTGQLGPAELGMAMIAHMTQTPIVPVYLKNTDGCFSPMHPGFRLVKAEVFYGKPLLFEEEFQQRANRATLQSMTDQVMGAIAQMRDASNYPPQIKR